MKRLFKYFFLLLVMCFSVVNIANAAFWVSNSDDISASPTIDSTNYVPVCYVGDNKYRSIEEAINAVGYPSNKTTIYVYPDLIDYDGSRRTVYIKKQTKYNILLQKSAQ